MYELSDRDTPLLSLPGCCLAFASYTYFGSRGQEPPCEKNGVRPVAGGFRYATAVLVEICERESFQTKLFFSSHVVAIPLTVLNRITRSRCAGGRLHAVLPLKNAVLSAMPFAPRCLKAASVGKS